MKRFVSLLLCGLLLAGCGSNTATEVTTGTEPAAQTETAAVPAELADPEQFPDSAPEYVSRFDTVTTILLSDEGIKVNDGGETDAVFTSHDIIYYEDRDAYDSGNPYGEGEAWERHSEEEAAAHTVVNITAPGAYRVSGKLSAGQIRVDLGDNAYEDPDAVVELILSGADITCTVAPAILFLNTYECDGMWSVDNATPDVDTSAAGANLILELENTISGSHVAKIFKDKEDEKKLWKQDGAIYSYMSLNVFGPASLDLTADNEGLDSELHLTINGGNISIFSDNDGINTNEDGVSVTTINGGRLWITAGLGAEGDGIDSNGYLVINGGIVSASANPAADAGMDSDMGSFINGGTVIALGSTMDWAESDSQQVTMNLQFAQSQEPGTSLVVTREDGTVIFAYAPELNELQTRSFTGAIISSPNFYQGESYHVYTGGTLTGYAGRGSIAQPTTVTGYTGGTQMAYTGSDVRMGGGRPGGMGGFGGQRPEGFEGGERPENVTPPEGETMPSGFDPSQMGGGPGRRPDVAEEMTPPEGMEFPGGERPELPEGETFPEGKMPDMPEGGFGGRGQNGMQPGGTTGEAVTEFYMNDMVNSFSGITKA